MQNRGVQRTDRPSFRVISSFPIFAHRLPLFSLFLFFLLSITLPNDNDPCQLFVRQVVVNTGRKHLRRFYHRLLYIAATIYYSRPVVGSVGGGDDDIASALPGCPVTHPSIPPGLPSIGVYLRSQATTAKHLAPGDLFSAARVTRYLNGYQPLFGRGARAAHGNDRPRTRRPAFLPRGALG